MNNTLLTRPKRKKNKSVRNAHNKNYATHEQLMKLVVCDKEQALVTQSNNQLGKICYTYKVVQPVIEKSGNQKRQKAFDSPTWKGNKDVY